jgi:hypothetical protein
MIDFRDSKCCCFSLSLKGQEEIMRISIDYLNREVIGIMSGAKRKE